MASERGLWLKEVHHTYPRDWWDDEDTDSDKLHWFPVKTNKSTGRCSLDLRYAAIDSLPDEVLALVSELDVIFLTADAIEASVKTSTINKLRSHRKLHLHIHCRRNYKMARHLDVLPNIFELTIAGCEIELELAKGDMLCLTRLTSLALSFCGICEIPHWFSATMSSLLELILSDNYLSELPENFRRFLSLKSLDMARQKGDTKINLRKLYLPSSLEKLCLQSNCIYDRSIPDDFCSSLTLLESLNMRGPSTAHSTPDDWVLRVLPPSINCMKSLTILDLSNHLLDALPSTLADLHHLTGISLAWNKFSSFPRALLCLKRLKRLNLSHNTITELPEEIDELCMLEKLDMSHNRLRCLPVSLWSVDSLRTLLIGENPLDGVREGIILKYSTLRHLNIPVEVLSLFDLASLSSLSLLVVERQLEKDPNLRPIPSLPAKVTELQHLTELVAHKVGLVSIPDDICLIPSLPSLDVSYNQLECLPPNIGRLTRLCFLDAQYNKITSVPDQLWKINSLKFVILYQNLLTEIKSTADDLDHIEILDISGNRLSYLSTAFGDLSLGHPMVFYCDENPLLFPPSPLVKSRKCFSPVCSYMKAVTRFGTVRCGTLKVLVLGSYMAGKTSTVLSIINQRPSLTNPHDRTISIDRFDCQVPLRDGHKALIVRFFDALGQHTYAMTNQLFISEQSLNMIVVDADTYAKAENKCEAFQQLVAFYLDNVLDHNPAAVCLIVVTQADRVGFAESEVLSEDIRQRCLGSLDRRIRDCKNLRRNYTEKIEKTKRCMSFVCVCV